MEAFFKYLQCDYEGNFYEKQVLFNIVWKEKTISPF